MEERSMFIKKLMLVACFSLGFNLYAEKVLVNSAQYYGGGIMGTIVGLGVGHAIQERYLSKGWIFTLGEVVGGIVSIGDVKALGSTVRTLGGFVFISFKIWEIIDVWT